MRPARDPRTLTGADLASAYTAISRAVKALDARAAPWETVAATLHAGGVPMAYALPAETEQVCGTIDAAHRRYHWESRRVAAPRIAANAVGLFPSRRVRVDVMTSDAETAAAALRMYFAAVVIGPEDESRPANERRVTAWMKQER